MASPTTLTTGTYVPTAGEKAVFPPFDPSTFSSQLIWLAVTFGFLYFLLSRVALPRIGEVIEERRDRIQRDLDEAERLKGETERALKAYETSLGEARGKAQGIAKDQRDKLTAQVDGERARVEKQLGDQVAEAEKRIAVTKARALGQVQDIATETAGAVVKRLLGVDVAADEVKRAMAPAAGE